MYELIKKMWLPISCLTLAIILLIASLAFHLPKRQILKRENQNLISELDELEQNLATANKNLIALQKLAVPLKNYLDSGILNGERDINWAQQLQVRAAQLELENFSSNISARQNLDASFAHWQQSVQRFGVRARQETKTLELIDYVYKIKGLAFVDSCEFASSDGGETIGTTCMVYWYQAKSALENE